MALRAIAAVTRKSRGIGLNNDLPWGKPIYQDMKFFAKKTTETLDPAKQNSVIMGRKTYESIPEKYRPLPDRYNIVLSRTKTSEDYPGAKVLPSLDQAIDFVKNHEDRFESNFVIGGGNVYEQAIRHPECKEVLLTEICEDFECDTFFPELPGHYALTSAKADYNKTRDIPMVFKTFQNVRFTDDYEGRTDGERQYLKLIRETLGSQGRETRNSRTFSKFNANLSFDLTKGFPLLTTKKMFFKGIVEELLWFLKGDTNSLNLSGKGINIWLGNTTREFLDNRNLSHYEVGDIGPMYGFQWRHFGTPYHGMRADYENKGFDQLKNVISLIKNDPTSRRIMMSTFDPSKVKESVLAPCHGLITQFYIDNENRLSCASYQRSVDSIAGLPFNIASYALMTHIIAKATNTIPYKVHLTLGDVHIYDQPDHVEGAKQQIERVPYPMPTLSINKNLELEEGEDEIDQIVKYIESLEYKDFKVNDYMFHPPIKIDMVA